MTRDEVHKGDVYRNLKTGNLYQVIDIGLHSETEEIMVIYKRIEGGVCGGVCWVRPFNLFILKFEPRG